MSSFISVCHPAKYLTESGHMLQTAMGNGQKHVTIGGDIFDLTKFVLALFVFALHAHSIRIGWIPILRIAVPLFFIISSYFFFSKYDSEFDNSIKHKIYVKYINRNLLLYLFWTIVQFIPIMQHRGWFSHPFPLCLFKLIQSIFLRSTFVASWFIMATVITTSLLTILSKHGNNKLIWTLSFIFYILCCLCSNYRAVFPFVNDVCWPYIGMVCVPYNSFIIAFMWITIGRWLANSRICIKLSHIIILVVISTLLLFLEWLFVTRFHFQAASDVYLSLLFLCPSIFLLLQKFSSIKIPYAKDLRHLSVVIFCTHGALLQVLPRLFENIGIVHNMRYATILTLPCCLIIYYIIQFLVKRFPFFKYAY